MNEYICPACGARSYSAADFEHITNKACERCGGAVVPVLSSPTRKSIDDNILRSLRDTYINSVRDMALFPEGQPEHRRGERLAANTSHTVYALFGSKAAETLREEGLKEWERIRALA